VRVKSSPTKRVSTSADETIKALRDESILGFREEASAVTSEFRERVSPILGTLGAAWVLGLRPGRWKWSGVYYNEPTSWRHGCWECLDHWCSAFPGHLKAFAAELCEIGQDIESVKRELEAICLVVRNVESRNWLACFCGDGNPAATDWRAPDWLLDWPAELELDAIVSAASSGRLGDEQTNEICKAIQNAVGEELALARVGALKHAQILIAKENHSWARYKDKESGGTSEPRNNHQSKFHQRIVSLMKKHPAKSYREILGMVDGQEGLDIPNRFKKHEHSSRGMVMVGAYDCTECRRSVEVFMSLMREPLGLPQAPKSRRP